MQTTNLCIRKTEILHCLLHEIIHLKWLLIQICTLHITGLFIFFNKNIQWLIFLNYVCIAKASFSVFKSLRLFSLGMVVLTYKCEIWNLGSWKSVLSSLQSLNNCRTKRVWYVKSSALLQSFVIWESSIWCGHNFKFDFVFCVPVILLLLIACRVI